MTVIVLQIALSAVGNQAASEGLVAQDGEFTQQAPEYV